MHAHRRSEAFLTWLMPGAFSALGGWVTTRRWEIALLAFAAVSLPLAGLHNQRLPLHLALWGRFLLRVLLPAAGAALASCVALLDKPGSFSLGEAAGMVGVASAAALLGDALATAYRNRHPVRAAVIGSSHLAEAFAEEIDAIGMRRYRIIGFMDGCEHKEAPHETSTPKLGSLAQLEEVIAAHHLHLLVITEDADPSCVASLVRECLHLPVRLVSASDLYEDIHGRVPIGTISDTWFRHLLDPRFRISSGVLKRTFDLVTSALVLVLTAPLLAVLAALVKLHDGGRALYSQERVGERGRLFTIFKLRTMSELENPEESGNWCVQDDPRVTSLGRILRKTHLDEFPQLFNVLKGEMSLIGPRPERPSVVEGLEATIPHYQRRHLSKPGVTGWAQVQAGYCGSQTGTAYKLSHDLFYLRRASIWLDILILIETCKAFAHDQQYRQFTFSEAFLLGQGPKLEGEALLAEAGEAADSLPPSPQTAADQPEQPEAVITSR